jgi:hypothetical protein
MNMPDAKALQNGADDGAHVSIVVGEQDAQTFKSCRQQSGPHGGLYWHEIPLHRCAATIDDL